MAASVRPTLPRAPGTSFILLGGFLLVLWIAGGASIAEAPGQLVTRAAAWTGILAAILFGARPEWRVARPVMMLLVAAILLVCLQLIPLPPDVWRALPGRDRFAEAAALAGRPQPWRPLAIVPDAALNAAASLVAPFAVLVFMLGSSEAERARLPGVLLALVGASALLGVLQFSGAGLANPLVNNSPGEVSGAFANRNHFSLFLAIGCLIAPAWAFAGDRPPGWRASAALGLVLLFVLVILASGSRAGIGLAALGLSVGLLLARRGIRRALARGPRWLFPAVAAGVLALVAIFVLLSVAADRAVSVERIFATDAGQDMRTRALPAVLAMVGLYFPAGAGFGGFDPLFRVDEPFELLKPTFFNHAHNDFAEIVLDGGLPALLLLAAALCWWVLAGIRAWRAPEAAGAILPRLGSAVLLLVLVASVVDYPARTPLIMAVTVIAAIWLAQGASAKGRTLPKRDQHL